MDCYYTNMLTTAKFMVLVPSTPTSTSILTSECIDCISSWMCSNRLQLNADKSEVMWCTSTRRLPQLPTCLLCVAGASVYPVSVVRDLGVYIDNDLGATSHVQRSTMLRCFAALHQLRHLHRYVTDDCFHSLASLIHSRLDYGNFVLVRIPAYLQRQLQSVLNTAAHLVFGLRRYDHRRSRYWLRIPERVDFKVAVMTF